MKQARDDEEPPICGRDWAGLPHDVLLLIFLKIGLMEVLRAAGTVCRSWRKVAKEEPVLWQRIVMINHASVSDDLPLEDLARVAIDRSGGRLEEFAAAYFVDDNLLRYLCDRTSVLKRLCLMSCDRLSSEAIAEIAKRQPLLEEIRVSFGWFSKKLTEILGKECPKLIIFKFTTWFDVPRREPDNEEAQSDDYEAFGIAKTMHQLRHLQFTGNRMTNEGLKAILDGCPHLETLDISGCYNVKMDADMEARCERLKTVTFDTDEKYSVFDDVPDFVVDFDIDIDDIGDDIYPVFYDIGDY